MNKWSNLDDLDLIILFDLYIFFKRDYLGKNLKNIILSE